MAESKPLYVPDASVIIKWALQLEDGSEKAISLAEDFIGGKIGLMIPGHCYFEILNIINLKKPQLSRQFFSQLLNMNILEQSLTLEIAHLAGDIMRKLPGMSFYDAAYHALALANDGLFITADKKYYQKAGKLGGIKFLADYE